MVRAAPPLAPFTGLTPPTKEVTSRLRRSRSNVTGVSQEAGTGAWSSVTGGSRDAGVGAGRSLDPRLRSNTTLAAVKDEEMQRDLENYFKRFDSIQRSNNSNNINNRDKQ